MQSTARERLIGIWELVSIRETLPDGTERDRPDFGPAPAGFLVYTRTGHVSVHFMRRGRSPWREEEAPSADERASALAGYGGYAGTFTVREEEGCVLHHVEVAAIPNRVGRDLKRLYAFEGDRLILRPEPVEQDGVAIRRALTWKKVVGGRW